MPVDSVKNLSSELVSCGLITVTAKLLNTRLVISNVTSTETTASASGSAQFND